MRLMEAWLLQGEQRGIPRQEPDFWGSSDNFHVAGKEIHSPVLRAPPRCFRFRREDTSDRISSEAHGRPPEQSCDPRSEPSPGARDLHS